jgi:RNA polymerase sigma factor (sigma-70 family)
MVFIQGTPARQPFSPLADELNIISAAQGGDVRAFNQLVRVYQTRAHQTAFRVLGNADAAADATQEAFLSAFRHLGSYRGRSFKAWLMRIVTNACYDQLRKQQRRPTFSLEALPSDHTNLSSGSQSTTTESPQEVAERHELAAVIQEGLRRLPPEQSLTLVLADVDGFGYEEVAEISRTNLGTVKSRLARARAALRDFLLAQEEVLPRRYQYAPRTRTSPRTTSGLNMCPDGSA